MQTKLILIFSLIALINSACEPASTEELIQLKKLRDYEDCASRTSVEELEEAGAYKCCHAYYEYDSNNLYQEVDTCTLITKTQYDDIEKYVDQTEEYDGVKSFKIHCYEFNIRLKEYINVETGIFGADMKVSLLNDGPVTILLESRKHD